MRASFDIRNSSLGISSTRCLAVMNRALRGLKADFGPEPANTSRRDLRRMRESLLPRLLTGQVNLEKN